MQQSSSSHPCGGTLRTLGCGDTLHNTSYVGGDEMGDKDDMDDMDD